MTDPHAERSPVSRSLEVARLPAKGETVTIEADAAQRAALADAHGLLSVERFSAELIARPWKRGGVRVTGHLAAEITQACVVTLEPLAARVEEEIAALFVPEDSRLSRPTAQSGEMVVEAEGEDVPETFTGGRIDLGALAEEFFALGIDPYPRKEAARLEIPAGGEDGGGEAGPLFAQLRKLREKG
ncbi:YceD family protein [Chelativorans intermedius]|uniref:DUF177 domain-containing protein n=1 Tax=Chelativorans intermedius TaxID=515947 RepID=A0ABV6D4X2_9HYPH|nr:DUF177 domain-containing protein [Chelativorans intermedius]MCT8999047.1 DUF177 domain-containing protein [Chelativorans intermedius]